ncbi:hypothetical protein Dsin_004250 [Dipteronia sinensis]|uniref:Uncharacterized protein n=1 Tax=Dipteronia sinensis TaxID=43782 RepID=A0AAE0BB13_9ROSI|nr:hypothetical protein Dsin_004250 [Dipteronia sinensis]
MAQSHETVPNTITMAQSHETVPNSTITMAQSNENKSPKFTESQDAAGIVGSVEINKSHDAFISIYTDGIPTWHCTNKASTTCNSNHFEDICKLSSFQWAWDEIPSKTIVSEWGL